MLHCRLFCVAISTVFLVLLLPIVASAQFKDLDAAMQNLTRGFGSGDPQAIVSGMGGSDQVQLQFPGLTEQSGILGRDQAAYLLDGLFSKVKPSAFKMLSARKVAAEGQYRIKAQWTIQLNGKRATRTLNITLHQTNAGWSLASVNTTGK